MPEPTHEILPGFEPDAPQPEVDSDAIAAAAALHPHVDSPDATDRWLEETGGGPRRETLAVDPPKPRRARSLGRRRRGRSGPDYSDDPRLETGDPNPQFIPGQETAETRARQAAINAAGRAAVEAASRHPFVVAKSIGGSELAHQAALSAVRAQRRPRK